MALVEQRTFYKGEAILNLNAFQIFLFRPGGDPLVEVECSGSTCWLLYFVHPCDGGHFPAEVWLQRRRSFLMIPSQITHFDTSDLFLILLLICILRKHSHSDGF